MKSLITLLNLLIIVHVANSQAVFQRSYGGPGNEYGRAVIECSTGGYLIVGSSNSYYNPSTDVYLLRVDVNGDYMWGRNIGNADKIDWGIDVAEDTEGNFIIAGYTDDSPTGSYDGLLIKTDPEGQVLWKKTFGGDDWDFIESMTLNTEDEIILAGSKTENGIQKGWVFKTDNNGVVIWEEVLDSSGKLKLTGIDVCDDQNIVFTGYSTNTLLDTKIIVSGQMSQSGGVIWISDYPEFGIVETGQCMCSDQHGLVVVGTQFSSAASPFTKVISVDINTGETLAHTDFPETFVAIANGIDQNLEGDLYISNGIEGFGFGQFDSGIYKLGVINPSILVESGVILGGILQDILFDLMVTNDGGIIAVGETNSFGNNFQVHLCKLDSLLNTDEQNTDFLDLATLLQPITIENQIKIYPNPAQNLIYIDIEQKIDLRYEILGGNGKLFLSDNLFTLNQVIDISGLSQGLYVLNLYDGDEIISASRFVKQP